ncbi:hypothetical protein G9A89_001302 [Geosiphon pyriformis]|nr:hypothetical protein G9A89_003514 [Geosiphon pyriformis]KAG9294061.1 hypothetical protein G9A89_001302 [Geosiphon pyriformis]
MPNSKWTPEEDRLLISRIEPYDSQQNPNPWRTISEDLPNRTPDSCRERWSSDWDSIAKELSFDPNSRRTTRQVKNYAMNQNRKIQNMFDRLKNQYERTGNKGSLGYILN